jgi:hypothetical protein
VLWPTFDFIEQREIMSAIKARYGHIRLPPKFELIVDKDDNIDEIDGDGMICKFFSFI